MAQHKVATGLDEVARQGFCRHAATAYHYTGLRPNGGCMLRHSVVQVRD